MKMICERCGAVIERKNALQKYCMSCSCQVQRDRFKQKPEKYKESQQRHYAKKKAEREAKKPYVAGTGCTKWRTCEYGWPVLREGHCRYNEMTGKCKIIEVDGVKTVAPTKNCKFYKRKKRDDAS